MHKVNPLVIPRNYKVEEALQAANKDDLIPIKDLLKVLQNPYDSNVAEYINSAPRDNQKYQTFCGT